VEQELRDKENLKTVYFEGNPLQTKGPAVYRNKVRLALPQVIQIDASKCSFLSVFSSRYFFPFQCFPWPSEPKTAPIPLNL